MIVDGWVDWALRLPAHPEKVYSQLNSGEWITCHSVVGDLPGHAVPSRFLSDERRPDGRFTDAAAASSMFVLYKDGILGQAYPLSASTWTSGGREANTRSFAIEAEGGFDPTTEPLTVDAELTFARLFRELAAHQGWDTSRPLDYLKQHKDVAREFGYGATSCASDRYANAWRNLVEDAEQGGTMTQAEKEEMEALRKRRALAWLVADLERYDAMLDVFEYAKRKGYLT